MRTNMRKQGAEFEYQARLFLQKQGLHFIAANQSFPCGEIDLIMREQEVLVFIEVRQRKNSNYGTAAESVDWRKQQKLVKTANLWLAQQDMSLDNIDCRFDLITFNHKSNQINWFPNFIELNN